MKLGKLFAAILAAVFAIAANAASDKEIERFVAQSFEQNPNFSFNGFKLDKREAVKGLRGWDKVDFTISALPKGQMQAVSQRGSLYIGKTTFIGWITDSGAKRASDADLISAIKKRYAQNPNLSIGASKITKRVKVDEADGFEAIFAQVDFEVSGEGGKRKLSATEILFANGGFITDDIYRLSDGLSLKEGIKGEVIDEHYKDEYIIAGNAEGKAKYKIIVFSDPLCPACRATLPDLIAKADKNPSEISLYYYNLPTHGVSPILMKAAIARSLAGVKNAERAMYEDSGLNDKYMAGRGRNDRDALDIFNETFGTKFTMDQINTPAVLERYNFTEKVSGELAVNSTPSIFINGKYDAKRTELRKILERLK